MSITTGVRGGSWRATVTPWGALQTWRGGEIGWYVAADDRWHVPGKEPSVRQSRIEGTPVVETRVRVPGGDVVQRIHSVADAGGFTVIEVANDSALPVAVAFDAPVRSPRAPSETGVVGLDLPPGSRAFPIGHHSSTTVGVAHDGRTSGPWPAGLPAADAVVRGWRAATARAGRFVLPEERFVDEIVALRSELLLGGPGEGADGEPAELLVGIGQLVRMGEAAAPWIDDIAAAVERIARRGTGGWYEGAALDAAAEVLVAAGERRALADLDALRTRRRDPTVPGHPPSGPLFVAWVEQTFADRHGRLFGGGWPPGWLGVDVEAHDVPVGPRSRVSYAIRWHGARPAILWERTGEPVTLTAPAVAPEWAAAAATGEALWPAPGGG